MGKKKNKKWLIYAYSPQTKEIVAWVWGKGNKKTARKLREKWKKLGEVLDKFVRIIGRFLFLFFRKITIKLIKNTPLILKEITRV